MAKRGRSAKATAKGPGLSDAAKSAGMSVGDFCSQKQTGSMGARCKLYQTLSALVKAKKKGD